MKEMEARKGMHHHFIYLNQSGSTLPVVVFFISDPSNAAAEPERVEVTLPVHRHERGAKKDYVVKTIEAIPAIAEADPSFEGIFIKNVWVGDILNLC